MGNDGFITGLKLWLIFFLAFFLMGYRDPKALAFSIFLGIIAGLAGRSIANGLAIKKPIAARPAAATPQATKGLRGAWRDRLDERARSVSSLLTQRQPRKNRNLKSKR